MAMSPGTRAAEQSPEQALPQEARRVPGFVERAHAAPAGLFDEAEHRGAVPIGQVRYNPMSLGRSIDWTAAEDDLSAGASFL